MFINSSTQIHTILSTISIAQFDRVAWSSETHQQNCRRQQLQLRKSIQKLSEVSSICVGWTGHTTTSIVRSSSDGYTHSEGPGNNKGWLTSSSTSSSCCGGGAASGGGGGGGSSRRGSGGGGGAGGSSRGRGCMSIQRHRSIRGRLAPPTDHARDSSDSHAQHGGMPIAPAASKADGHRDAAAACYIYDGRNTPRRRHLGV